MKNVTAGGNKLARFLMCVSLTLPLVALPPFMSGAQAETDGFSGLFANFGKKHTGNRVQQSAAANNGHQFASNGSKVSTTTEVVWDRNLQPMLTSGAGEALRAAEAHYRQAIAQGGFPKVSRSILKKGSTGKAVIVLNQRLFMEGYLRVEATQGEYASIFTSATEDALRRFQANMGLAVTGKTDAQTADLLNVPAETRLRTIEANLARADVYEQGLGDRYVIVNIPAQQIQTVQEGRVYSQHNAIVGRVSRPSPVVMAALSDINFNPYWNAPVSIVEQDIVPKLLSGTRLLEDMNMKVFKGYGGPEIDPDSVNWRTATPDDYYFRQEPGPENAMATAKINFPSPFGIYMHDTPEKQLFKGSPRFYSSGCVRVENMSLLVQWVLNGQDGIGADQIATLAETLERKDVKLIDPPQLRVVYLTAWPTAGGTVAFRNDVYELDGTGFTVGQPMPLGERSPDGQRFVLKPLPRLVAEVDEGGSAGGLFNWGRKTTNKPVAKPFNSSTSSSSVKRSSFFGSPDENAPTTKKPVKSIFGDSTTAKKQPATVKKTAAKQPTKARHGLFDWTPPDQKASKTKVASKPKTLLKKTDAKTKSAAATADSKLAKDKKTATTVASKPTLKPDAKVAAKDAKAAGAGDASKSASTAKVDKPALKPVADCKAGKDGKLPAGCKPVADASGKPKTATN
jgi:hypothetical protein